MTPAKKKKKLHELEGLNRPAGQTNHTLKQRHNALLTPVSTTSHDGLPVCESPPDSGVTRKASENGWQEMIDKKWGVCAGEWGFSCLGPNGPNEAGGEDGGCMWWHCDWGRGSGDVKGLGWRGLSQGDWGRPERSDSTSTPYELAACHIPVHHWGAT